MTGRTSRHFPDLQVVGGQLSTDVRYLISTRGGGASRGDFARGNLADHVGDEAEAVHSNRSALAAGLGAERGLAVISAVHGGSTRVVQESGTYAHVDALVTDRTGLGLLALGADCAVVGIAATRPDGSAVIGVAHCGWQGLTADVLGSVVAGIREIGGARLSAVVGPTICGPCYPVDLARIDRIRTECTHGVSAAAVGPRTADGSYQLDIRAGVNRRLAELGVRIEANWGCSAEDDRWFSHRRTTGASGPNARTGRHGLAILIDSREEPRATRQGRMPP